MLGKVSVARWLVGFVKYYPVFVCTRRMIRIVISIALLVVVDNYMQNYFLKVVTDDKSETMAE